MSLKTHVAFTASEWRRVRELYNSQEVSGMQEALDILDMWESRMAEKSALFIPCTKMILRCRLEEKQLELTPDLNKTESLKMLLGSCVIRVVNFANEISQTNKTYVKMATAVAEVGIPGWIVELRHQLSHAVNYPSIYRLRKCLEFVTEWLWEKVWQNPQQALLADATCTDASEWERSKAQGDKVDSIIASLRKFMKWRLNSMSRDPNITYTQEEVNQLPQLTEIRKYVETDYEDFLDVLVSDGFLVLEQQQAENEELLCADEIARELRSTWQLYWSPIISLLVQHNLIADLLLKMLNRLQEPKLSKLSETQLVAWVKLTVEGFSTISGQFTVDDWRRVLQAMMAAPLMVEQAVIKSVMAMIPTMKRKQRGQVKELMNLVTDENQEAMEGDFDSATFVVHLVDQVFKILEESNSQTVNNAAPSQESNRRWTRCDPAEWRDVPLGLCPGQTAESLNLIMDEEYFNRLRQKERR